MSTLVRRVAGSLLLWGGVSLGGAAGACAVDAAAQAPLASWAAQRWQGPDAALRRQVAFGLLPCLASPDPRWRDEFAFGALGAWMRDGSLDEAAVRAIGQRVQALMAVPDPAGFGPSFAALVLAEVARVDRLRPFWSADERLATVAAATAFVRGVRDYRGFDPKSGWRHAVAHGADLLMQLSLNPALDRAQLDLLLDAVASQWLPPGHYYIHGEGGRLARPVLFVARRGLHGADEWRAWLARLGDVVAADAAAPASEASLARMHNAREFVLPLYAAVQQSSDAALRARLLPGLSALLERLP